MSFAKVMIGSLVFLSSLLVAGFFVTSSIRGSFVSIGRNPMASAVIYRNLAQVTAAAVVIILIGSALAYVILVI